MSNEKHRKRKFDPRQEKWQNWDFDKFVQLTVKTQPKKDKSFWKNASIDDSKNNFHIPLFDTRALGSDIWGDCGVSKNRKWLVVDSKERRNNRTSSSNWGCCRSDWDTQHPGVGGLKRSNSSPAPQPHVWCNNFWFAWLRWREKRNRLLKDWKGVQAERCLLKGGNACRIMTYGLKFLLQIFNVSDGNLQNLDFGDLRGFVDVFDFALQQLVTIVDRLITLLLLGGTFLSSRTIFISTSVRITSFSLRLRGWKFEWRWLGESIPASGLHCRKIVIIQHGCQSKKSSMRKAWKTYNRKRIK